MSNIFKKIINREIPTAFLYEDDLCIAINDIKPVAPVHILIIPKKEIPTINDLNEDDINIVGHLVYVAKKIAKKNKIDSNGFRLVFNCNDDGGQTVYHLHLHLLGGKKLNRAIG
ncbi:MAG: histidine triad nucleotide-binding protein [Candidatus Marinimicrobia bacterium]|nr:histidine triad nucleotide-binding protein [Candidatus Neomarinimicrobiota bacterium]|tara:strand:- start:16211 stop:16552 length:342 start_codon:yes stop_codon:yes gene_type:complete